MPVLGGFEIHCHKKGVTKRISSGIQNVGILRENHVVLLPEDSNRPKKTPDPRYPFIAVATWEDHKYVTTTHHTNT
jgi:hypothetical protein